MREAVSAIRRVASTELRGGERNRIDDYGRRFPRSRPRSRPLLGGCAGACRGAVRQARRAPDPDAPPRAGGAQPRATSRSAPTRSSIWSRRAGPRPAPITIYRALDFLTAQGLVHRIESRNAFLACINNHAADAPVVFLICEHCGAVGEAPSARGRREPERGGEERGLHAEEPGDRDHRRVRALPGVAAPSFRQAAKRRTRIHNHNSSMTHRCIVVDARLNARGMTE